MGGEYVLEAMCAARTEKQNVILERMSSDMQNVMAGVGKINRRLFEGNGEIALDVQIRQNTEFRQLMIERAERDAERRAAAKMEEEVARKRLRRQWLLSGAGWGVAAVIAVAAALIGVYAA